MNRTTPPPEPQGQYLHTLDEYYNTGPCQIFLFAKVVAAILWRYLMGCLFFAVLA